MNSYKIDEQQVQKSNFETMPRLFRYLLKYKKRIAGVFALMAFGTAVDLVNPLLSERAIDRYIIPGNVAGLIRVVALGATINILAVLAIKLRMLLMAKTSNKVIQELRQELYDHIQSLDLAFFDSRPSGKILARIIGDSNSLKDIIENAVTTLIPNLVTVIAVMAIMFVKNWKLALAALCSLPFLIVDHKARLTVGIDVGRGMGHVVVEQVAGIRYVGGADIPERRVVLDAVEQVEVFGLNGA